jgi:hypothetical protein
MNSVKLITVTPKAEETMGYVARVSNPIVSSALGVTVISFTEFIIKSFVSP